MNLILFKNDGIIPIYQNETEEKLVNARELHEFMDIQSKFADWIKNRIEKYEFIESQDYVTLSNFLENGGRSKEYILKMDTAKEIAMVENNEKGRQVRKYFIEVEKKAKEFAQMPQIPKTLPEALRLAAEIEEKRVELQKQIETDRPKVIFAEALEVSNKTILIGELAKILKQNEIEIGQNRLFEWLRENSYLGRKGEYYNIPTQKAMELELFEIKTTTINNPDGSVRVTKTTKVTGKGQCYFINKFKKVA